MFFVGGTKIFIRTLSLIMWHLAEADKIIAVHISIVLSLILPQRVVTFKFLGLQEYMQLLCLSLSKNTIL